MSNTVEAPDSKVSTTGVSFVPTKEDFNKIRFLVPGSDRFVTLRKQPGSRKPATRIQFGMIRDRRLKVIQAIPVEIQRKGKTVVAAWEELEEFGYGRNISEALDDFGRTIEELFITLSEKQSALSGDLTRVHAILGRHIRFRQRG